MWIRALETSLVKGSAVCIVDSVDVLLVMTSLWYWTVKGDVSGTLIIDGGPTAV